MIVSFHGDAAEELRFAVAWLKEEAGARIADDFEVEFWRTIDVIKQRPYLGAPASRTSSVCGDSSTPSFIESKETSFVYLP